MKKHVENLVEKAEKGGENAWFLVKFAFAKLTGGALPVHNDKLTDDELHSEHPLVAQNKPIAGQLVDAEYLQPGIKKKVSKKVPRKKASCNSVAAREFLSRQDIAKSIRSSGQTLSMIGKLSGVSQSTVSRAKNNPSSMDVETRAKLAAYFRGV